MAPEKVILGALYTVLAVVLVVVVSVQVSDEGYSHAVAKFEAPGGESLRFHVLGDVGTLCEDENNCTIEQLALSMSARASLYPVDFVVAAGYNRSAKGVEDQFDQTVYDLLYHIFKKPGLQGKPWYLALGNVACQQDTQTFVEMSDLYSAWNLPSPYYNFSLHVNSTHVAAFVFLDGCTLACQAFDNTTIPAYCGTYSNLTTPDQVEEQYDWLDLVFADLEQTAQWRFVFVNMPPFSASSGDADNEALKKFLVPRLLSYNVDVVFAGHETLMEYFYLDRLEHSDYEQLDRSHVYDCSTNSYSPYGDRLYSQKGDALHELVMGAAGAPLEWLCPNKTTTMASLVYGAVSPGFLEVTISTQQVSATFFQYNNSAFNLTILAT